MEAIQQVLAGFERLAVAVSGGVDSMTLAWLAQRQLGPALTVFHAVSPAVPAVATARVRAHASRAGWQLRIVDAGEMADPRYLANPVNRCFFCKLDLYAAIRCYTDDPIASGANLDDLGDYRPGLKAAERHGVRHPLIEAGIDKAGVRALAAGLGLDDLAELPASPCLSSRIETGIAIDPRTLALVEQAEAVLRARFPQASSLRVRVRRDRLEVELDAPILENLDKTGRAELASAVVDAAPGRPVSFALYTRGSAFLRAG
jgi:uncharacterized protein